MKNKKTTSKRLMKKNKKSLRRRRLFRGGVDESIDTTTILNKYPDTGACFALGNETDKNAIKAYFGLATMDCFSYAKSAESVGGEGTNGFVTKIKFEKEGTSAHAILKSSYRSADSITIRRIRKGIAKNMPNVTKFPGNLMYEYEVGLFVNDQNKIFPCFIETYGLLNYSLDKYTALEKNRKEKIKDSSGLLEQINKLNKDHSIGIDYEIGCKSTLLWDADKNVLSHIDLGILMQHIEGEELHSFIDKKVADTQVADTQDADTQDAEKKSMLVGILFVFFFKYILRYPHWGENSLIMI
jgi:hypothetical protein